MSFGFSLGSAGVEVFLLLFAVAAWFVTPPAGIPASGSPVAGFTGSTGLLFGSAASVDPGALAFVG